MKKATAILFSVFYLSVTIGIAVNLHYCHGEIASVQFFSERMTSCCGDETEMDSNCCQNDSQVVQFENDQTLVSDFRLNLEQLAIDLPVPTENLNELVCFENKITFFLEADSPPPVIPAWLLYCSPIYYG